MKKHIFVDTKGIHLPNLIPVPSQFTCIYCEKSYGLEEWQILKMPRDMAKCEKSIIKITFLERLFSSINCLKG